MINNKSLQIDILTVVGGMLVLLGLMVTIHNILYTATMFNLEIILPLIGALMLFWAVRLSRKNKPEPEPDRETGIERIMAAAKNTAIISSSKLESKLILDMVNSGDISPLVQAIQSGEIQFIIKSSYEWESVGKMIRRENDRYDYICIADGKESIDLNHKQIGVSQEDAQTLFDVILNATKNTKVRVIHGNS